MENTSLNTVIIDSDVARRMRLKQATSSLALFKSAQQVTSPQEALQKLESAQHIDIVFLSTRIADAAIKDFIAGAKKKRTFRDSAFILVVEGKTNEAAPSLPQYLLLGIDGFLMEPYSVDRLVETSQIAASVKKDRAVQRKRLAVELILQDIDRTLSALAGFKAAGVQSTKLENQFKKLGASLRELDDESKLYFFDRITEVWSAMEKPLEILEMPKYQGASQRVKRIFEEKVLKQLEEMKAKSVEETL